ncbi:efflux RND transporter periplasmic adaptor subunit [Cognatiyoonia sp. IB215446]|uniref:efflux RND transporter periplasmic adaptor subunit n=1 Tax=Cognatiyoonia sp. IB215446 TaxID=3097355 RepID=UPI002A176105|nr:efflux RND transporter periplasmic adaptor subunit [Cognatiyoonia sp. IB215446]MDX8349400.1 efflux RND transporter periplasmic adaptor subunit [Cognatiyoonia sp. IB215446]
MFRFLTMLAVAALPFSTPLMAQEDIVRPAKLMVVGSNTNGITRQFFGQVVARQTVDLAFQVSGQIVEFPATEGEVTTQGGLIAKLDTEPFELQQQQAVLQVEQAERLLTRLNNLGDSASEVSKQDAETQLALARVDLRNAEYSLENATLTAPFDALVASRNVANFTTTNAGTPVVRLHDMSELRIDIDVPEVLFQRAGQDAAVSLFARFPTSDETYPLEIREFNAEASSIGQTFRLTLGMERPDGINVLPGSSVVVLATLNEGVPRLLVPATAIRIGNDGTTSVLQFIPTDDERGTVNEVAVEVTATRDGQFMVTSGLEPGTEIVRTGAQVLADGDSVRRFAGYAN